MTRSVHFRRSGALLSAAALVSVACLVAAGHSYAQKSSSDASATLASDGVPGPEVSHKGWPEAVPSKGLAAGMVLPLEKYLSTYPEEIAVQGARDTVETSCMKRHGFRDWRTEPLGVLPPPGNTAANMKRRYGLSDLAVAEKYGHHLPQDSVGRAVPRKAETAEAASVLRGVTHEGKRLRSFGGVSVPKGGCTGETLDRVGILDDPLAEELNGQSFLLSQEKPAVKQAMADWSRCMKESGFDVATVWDMEEVYDEMSATVTDAEIASAVAEVKCKQETGLIEVWFQEEVKIQQGLIKGNRKDLSAAKARNEDVLKRAAAVSEGAA